jgi:hypothetical protein
MALNESKRLRPFIRKADEDAYRALSAFKNYQPANASCAREHLAALRNELQAAWEQEIKLENALAAARDATRAAEWCFHNAMLDVKAQVIAQYGVNSDEVQALGLKKKSERRKPGRRRPKARPVS